MRQPHAPTRTVGTIRQYCRIMEDTAYPAHRLKGRLSVLCEVLGEQAVFFPGFRAYVSLELVELSSS